jgi:centrosomal protein CEP104
LGAVGAAASRCPFASPQGRDDLGRPLLERALRIQEARLGADHPDVAAIRDVLEEAG